MIKNKSTSHLILKVTALLAILAITCAPLAVTEAADQEKNILVPIQSITTGCIEFLKRNKINDVRDCGVSESGIFGKVDDQIYHYVLYCIIPAYSSEVGKCGDNSFSAEYYSFRGLAIFVQKESAKQAKLFMERGSVDIDVYVYEKPEIVKNSSGILMHVPIMVDGTGHGNASEYYIWSEKLRQWKLLNSTKWVDNLLKRVPPGLSILKGIWPDIRTMKAEAHLYREGDANCCPSGGNVFIELTLKDDQFVMRSVEFKINQGK